MLRPKEAGFRTYPIFGHPHCFIKLESKDQVLIEQVFLEMPTTDIML